MTTKQTPRTIAIALASISLISGCASDARNEGLENRQDRMDSRNESRVERRQLRGDREDARVKARMDAW